MRPVSIQRFELAYLGSILVWAVNAALGWQIQKDAIDARFAAMPGMASWGLPLLIGITAIAAIVPLLLWYFVARRGSVVAKWIVVALFVLSVAALPMTLAGFRTTGLLPAALNLVIFLLNAVAVWMLFRPDARAWFGAPAVPADEPLP